MVEFSTAYADQNERDYATVADALKDSAWSARCGKLTAEALDE